ncbi:MAG TPA: hypothetical protein VF188_14405 [Longimicrobiales bacterium]
METTIETFQALAVRAGTVVRAEPFPEARKPAIELWIDFGAATGVQERADRGLTRARR